MRLTLAQYQKQKELMLKFSEFTGDYSFDMTKMQLTNNDFEIEIYERDVRRNIKIITKMIKKDNIRDADEEEIHTGKAEKGVVAWRLFNHIIFTYYKKLF